MLKRIANAIRSTTDENDEEINPITLLDKLNIEIITLKCHLEELFNLKIWLNIISIINSKPNEINELKHIKSDEKCYFDNNYWFLFTG